MLFVYWFLSVLLALLLCLVALAINFFFFRPFSLNRFYDKVMLHFALANPETMSMIRVFEKFGYHGHNKRLNNESDVHKKRQEAKLRQSLGVLQSYRQDNLKPAAQLSFDIMQWFLRDAVEGLKFSYHNYPVNQLFGVQNQLPTFLATMHQIKNKRDAKYFVIRLSKVKLKFEQVIEGLSLREAKGIMPPRFVFEKVIEEITNFLAVSPRENILYISMADKLDKVGGLGQADKAALLQQAEREIARTVYPAYGRLKEYLASLEHKATDHDGVWKLPLGGEYYSYLLRHYTTAQYSAQEIHNIGLQEMTRIKHSMAEILDGLSYHGEHPIEMLKILADEERFKYPDTEEARRQVLVDYRAIIERIDANMGHLFDIRPNVGVVVDRIPEFKEKTAPGAYYNPPAADGSRPGVFSVNLHALPIKLHMETLAVHEAIPGHHFQLAIQQELRGLPLFRRFLPFTAYAEGWALYSEKIIYENRLFSDAYSALGFLASELFRAVRLVVDTGIHHKGWTRAEAIEFMVQNTGHTHANVVVEVERYIVMPGQATAYKMGELEILRLRERAKEALGSAFDLKAFHNVLLESGSLPLEILGKQVDDYIAAKQRVGQFGVAG